MLPPEQGQLTYKWVVDLGEGWESWPQHLILSCDSNIWGTISTLISGEYHLDFGHLFIESGKI